VEATVRIDRPAAEVFAFVAHAKNLPRWADGVIWVEPLTEGEPDVGARFRVDGSFLAVGHGAYGLVLFEPPWELAAAGDFGPLRLEDHFWFLDDHGTTEVTRRTRTRPRGGRRLLAPLIRRKLDRAVRSDLSRLKAALESGS